MRRHPPLTTEIATVTASYANPRRAAGREARNFPSGLLELERCRALTAKRALLGAGAARNLGCSSVRRVLAHVRNPEAERFTPGCHRFGDRMRRKRSDVLDAQEIAIVNHCRLGGETGHSRFARVVGRHYSVIVTVNSGYE